MGQCIGVHCLFKSADVLVYVSATISVEVLADLVASDSIIYLINIVNFSSQLIKHN